MIPRAVSDQAKRFSIDAHHPIAQDPVKKISQEKQSVAFSAGKTTRVSSPVCHFSVLPD
jgi:hypothetical protein